MLKLFFKTLVLVNILSTSVSQAEQSSNFISLALSDVESSWATNKEVSWFNWKANKALDKDLQFQFNIDFLLQLTNLLPEIKFDMPKHTNILFCLDKKSDRRILKNAESSVEKKIEARCLDYLNNNTVNQITNTFLFDEKKVGALVTGFAKYKNYWALLELPLQFSQVSSKLSLMDPLVKQYNSNTLDYSEIVSTNIPKKLLVCSDMESDENNNNFSYMASLNQKTLTFNSNDRIPMSLNLLVGGCFFNSKYYRNNYFIKVGFPFVIGAGIKAVIGIENGNNIFNLLFSVNGEITRGTEIKAKLFNLGDSLAILGTGGELYLAKRTLNQNESIAYNESISSKIYAEKYHDKEANMLIEKRVNIKKDNKSFIRTLFGLEFGHTNYRLTFGTVFNYCENFKINLSELKNTNYEPELQNKDNMMALQSGPQMTSTSFTQISFVDDLEEGMGYAIKLGSSCEFFKNGLQSLTPICWLGGELSF